MTSSPLPTPVVRKPAAWADMPYRDTALAQLDRDERQAQDALAMRLTSPRPRFLVIDEFWLLHGLMGRRAAEQPRN